MVESAPMSGSSIDRPGESAADPLWYKDAIVYQMHVKAFHDANGDGIGDFAGLIQKLDYIQELGVNTIWLLPFYPSPQRDDGYDIADYRDVHPDYGTLDDFKRFVTEAHRRDLRVITELVINHTSEQHPWFQAARRAPPGSPEHEFYVWSDTDKKFANTRIIFTDTESSNWAWDPLARRYYWHRFFSHQPDLNHNNPQVVDALIDVMRFWLDIGVDGLRLDAIPYLCVAEGTNNENLPETHAVLKQMRAVVDANYHGRLFLAEANQWPEDVREYFGDGDECHMAFHFPLMPRIFMAVALEDRFPIAEILRQTPDIPDNCQWAIFLRNHDELTLEMVTDRERDYMYKMYAQEPRMRVNVGIRRRLAPLLGNDVDRIKLMYSLLLSMPGSPIMYYGDEIGMGDNIYIGDRNGVRTPMQWSIDRNAGFSRADPQRLYLPIIMDPVYGYQAVNVEAQSRDPSSLLNWTRHILTIRRRHRCFGRGTLEFIRPQNRKIIAYVRSFENELVLCVANLAQSAQAVELDLSRYKGRVPVELSGNNAFPPIGDLPYFLTLPAHSFFWLALSDSHVAPSWHVERLPAAELPWLVLTDGIKSLDGLDRTGSTRSITRRTLQQLEQEVLPEFLRQRGWIRGTGGERVQLGERMVWSGPHGDTLLTLIHVDTPNRPHERFALPLTLAWDDAADSEILRTADWTLARVREHARVGVLVDALADPAFCASIVKSMAANERIEFTGGALIFATTPAWHDMNIERLTPVERFGTDPLEVNVVLGESVFLKAYRRADAGINPDVEMVDFLTRAGFTHVAALAGTLTCLIEGSAPISLAAVQAYVRHQGDALTFTLDHLERVATQLRSGSETDGKSLHTLFYDRLRTLGRRIGEMHAVLCTPVDDPAFAPEALTFTDMARIATDITQLADTVISDLERRFAQIPEASHADATRLIESETALDSLVRQLASKPVHGIKARHHGNLLLRKVLLVADDFVITDFEGILELPLEERRWKAPPSRDVATVLCSLEQARSAALDRVLSSQPELYDRVVQAFESWLSEASDVFMAGYTRGAQGSASLPRDPGEAAALIRLFRIERSLRDLGQDLERHPASVGASVVAVLSLLANR
ncbi:MAG TPA: maltose alpha-D-glucosyltransferase [Povalibacter sp.]